MKNIKFLIGALALMVCNLFITGCSDDKDNVLNKEDIITFPELVKENKEVGESGTISFYAATNWRLTSSALWLTLDNDEGESGEQTVTYTISGENAEPGKVDVAEVKLFMSSQEQVIYEITRGALAFSLIAKDAEGNEITEENPFVIAYKGASEIIVNANFRWAVTSKPEWADITSDVFGDANADKAVSFIMTSQIIKDAENGIISFGNEEGTLNFDIPVVYEGMPADEIAFSLENAWGWYFTQDGSQYYRKNIESNTAEEKFYAPFKFTVYANGDNYKVIQVNKTKWGWTPADSSAEEFDVENDGKGNLEVYVPSNTSTEEKTAAVMVLPMSVYNSLNNDLDVMFEENEEGSFDFKDDYLKYVALEFIQEAKEEDAPFTVYNEETGEVFDLIAAEYMLGSKDDVEAMFGTTNAWILPLENTTYNSIIIQPNNITALSGLDYNTFFNEADSKWNGVEFETDRNPETYKRILRVMSILPNSNVNGFMVVNIYRSGSLYGVICFEQ